MSFPIDSIVQVNIDRITQFPTQQGFGTPLVLDINTVQSPGDVDTFTSLEDVTDAGFATSSEAYKAASALLSQSPRPEEIKIARRETNVAQVSNIDVTGANDGTYTVTINGTPFSFVASGNTAAQIRTGLVAAINAGSEPVTAAPGAGDDLDLTADVAGDGFSVVLTSNPNSNMVLTETTANVGAASELLRVIDTDDDFYFVLATSRTEQDILQLAETVEGLVKLYFFDTDEADSKDLPAMTDTTSIFGQLKALGYDRTAGVWSEDLDNYPAAAWVGKCAPKDPGSITWKFKSVNGVTPDDTLTPTEKGTIQDKNANTYTTVGGNAIFENGTVMGGEFIDIMHGTDFISARIKENVFFALTSEDKIPFTNGGIAQVVLQIESVLRLAIDQGILSEEPSPPVVTAPDITEVPIADRAARFLQGIEFEGYYAGAIHKVKIQGRLSV